MSQRHERKAAMVKVDEWIKSTSHGSAAMAASDTEAAARPFSLTLDTTASSSPRRGSHERVVSPQSRASLRRWAIHDEDSSSPRTSSPVTRSRTLREEVLRSKAQSPTDASSPRGAPVVDLQLKLKADKLALLNVLESKRQPRRPPAHAGGSPRTAVEPLANIQLATE